MPVAPFGKCYESRLLGLLFLEEQNRKQDRQETATTGDEVGLHATAFFRSGSRCGGRSLLGLVLGLCSTLLGSGSFVGVFVSAFFGLLGVTGFLFLSLFFFGLLFCFCLL